MHALPPSLACVSLTTAEALLQTSRLAVGVVVLALLFQKPIPMYRAKGSPAAVSFRSLRRLQKGPPLSRDVSCSQGLVFVFRYESSTRRSMMRDGGPIRLVLISRVIRNISNATIVEKPRSERNGASIPSILLPGNPRMTFFFFPGYVLPFFFPFLSLSFAPEILPCSVFSVFPYDKDRFDRIFSRLVPYPL